MYISCFSFVSSLRINFYQLFQEVVLYKHQHLNLPFVLVAIYQIEEQSVCQSLKLQNQILLALREKKPCMRK